MAIKFYGVPLAGEGRGAGGSCRSNKPLASPTTLTQPSPASGRGLSGGLRRRCEDARIASGVTSCSWHEGGGGGGAGCDCGGVWAGAGLCAAGVGDGSVSQQSGGVRAGRPVLAQNTAGLGLGVTPIGPGWRGAYLLGADALGRDVAARLLYRRADFAADRGERDGAVPGAGGCRGGGGGVPGRGGGCGAAPGCWTCCGRFRSICWRSRSRSCWSTRGCGSGRWRSRRIVWRCRS